MDRNTFNETFDAFRGRMPFRPFYVVMVSGKQYEVDHPGALALRDGMVLFAAPGNIPVFFDYESVSEIVGDLMGQSAEH